MPGTAYVLFHHVMGESGGARGVWAYVRGGMGGLTQALAAAARDFGAEIRCDAEVERILVRDGRAIGVALESGDEFHAPIVASNADANVTFLRLLDRSALPESFVAGVERISYASASLKINVALSELPNFQAAAGYRARASPSRDDPHLPRPGLHRARVRRRQVRPTLCRAGAGVHDSVGRRPDGRTAWASSDVDVRPVRAVRAP